MSQFLSHFSFYIVYYFIFTNTALLYMIFSSSPIQSTEIVNTAVLNGVRVHYPVRVFAVSHGGDVFVITDRLGCQSSNSSIVKVSNLE